MNKESNNTSQPKEMKDALNACEVHLEQALSYVQHALELHPNEQLQERLKCLKDNLELCISNKSKNNKNVQIEDFQCPLCLKLFYEPITTPCGHTFCKTCLIQNLDYIQNCPTCKESLHFSVEHPVNVTLKTMLNKLFPQESKARIDEEDGLIQRSTHSTPLFILNAQCFPGQEFNLHIFEPRYRLMMRRVMAGHKHFGLVNCLQKQDGSWEMLSVGIYLKVANIKMLADGRSLVTTVGTRRFKVLEHWDLDGYKVGKVEFFDDSPKQNGQIAKEKQLAEEAKQLLNDAITKGTLSSIGGLQNMATAMREQIANAPTNIDELSWWMVSQLPLASEIKSAFLNTSSTSQRFEMIINLLSSNQQQHDDSSEHRCSIS